MAVYSKRALSGAANGRPIIVANTTAGTADTIHTAVSGTSDFDEIHLWATVTSTTDRKVSILWGDSANTELIEEPIRAEDGLVYVVPGLILQNGLIVKAFAPAANEILIYGFVNRIDVA